MDRRTGHRQRESLVVRAVSPRQDRATQGARAAATAPAQLRLHRRSRHLLRIDKNSARIDSKPHAVALRDLMFGAKVKLTAVTGAAGAIEIAAVILCGFDGYGERPAGFGLKVVGPDRR